MKKIIPVSATGCGMLFAVFLFASVSIGFGKPQRNSAYICPGKTTGASVGGYEKDGNWRVVGEWHRHLGENNSSYRTSLRRDLRLNDGAARMRGIVIKDKAWVCSDRETWHAGSPEDRLPYDWTHTPIMAGRIVEMPFEKVGAEQRDGQTWLHIRLRCLKKKMDPKACRSIGWCSIPRQAQYIATSRCR